jgi:hypothetical protein
MNEAEIKRFSSQPQSGKLSIDVAMRKLKHLPMKISPLPR